jgi:hypothetical protein
MNFQFYWTQGDCNVKILLHTSKHFLKQTSFSQNFVRVKSGIIKMEV